MSLWLPLEPLNGHPSAARQTLLSHTSGWDVKSPLGCSPPVSLDQAADVAEEPPAVLSVVHRLDLHHCYLHPTLILRREEQRNLSLWLLIHATSAPGDTWRTTNCKRTPWLLRSLSFHYACFMTCCLTFSDSSLTNGDFVFIYQFFSTLLRSLFLFKGRNLYRLNTGWFHILRTGGDPIDLKQAGFLLKTSLINI